VSKIVLSDIEKETIIKCLNEGIEFPLEIVKKIAPGFFDKLAQAGEFDYRLLDKYKIPILDYEGKRSEPAILASAALLGESSPLQILRYFDGKDFKHNGDTQEEIFDILEKQKRGEDDWRNLIVQGDNLLFLKACYLNQDPLIKDKVKGKVKLVYIDPPFGTGDEYGGAGGEMSYSAKIAGAEFIEAIRERLIYLRELLSDDGVIFVRQGYNFGHYIKLVMDEVFGRQYFINEIVVNRGKQRLGGAKKFSTATDSVFFYSKSNNYNFVGFKRERYSGEAKSTNMLMKGERNPRERTFLDPDGEKVVLIPPPNTHWKFIQVKIDEMYDKGIIYLAKSSKGLNSGILKIEKERRIPVDYVPSFRFDDDKSIDANWSDIPGYTQTTDYPTENSEELLLRVISSASSHDDLVMDIFGGSGTTAAVAEKLGRRWITGDFGKHSIYTMQKRILTISDSKKLKCNDGKGDKYGKNPRPFIIASVGSFDFSRIVSLRQHKEAYINFILTLFNIQERSSEELSKYKLPNIYGLKDGDPVEIYPIWEDDYLKSIKIDKDYLKGLAEAEGGKLKGTYYIIAPEICDRVGDWDYKTSQANVVSFRILSYPYKILEEISRSQQLSEQPGSSSEINKLISSTRFYFNQDVTCKLAWHTQGLQISDLVTAITDKSGNEIKGLDALAMVLIDKDYDGKMFTMEEAVYRKDIKDDGIIPVAKLTDKVAAIVIDRHGNESKIMILER